MGHNKEQKSVALTAREVCRKVGDAPFPKVRAAREIFRERAIEILEAYLAVISEARAAGNVEVAAKSLQWLMEHMPEEEGSRMLEVSIDKPQPVEVGKGPTINIGFALGGVAQPKALLEATVIDVTPKPEVDA